MANEKRIELEIEIKVKVGNQVFGRTSKSFEGADEDLGKLQRIAEKVIADSPIIEHDCKASAEDGCDGCEYEV